MLLFSLITLQISVEEKLKNAPDDGYQTGVIIGSFLPFIILIGVAYWMYYRTKDKKE